MLHIQEIRKNPDGLTFEQGFDLTQELQMRNPEILKIHWHRGEFLTES